MLLRSLSFSTPERGETRERVRLSFSGTCRLVPAKCKSGFLRARDAPDVPNYYSNGSRLRCTLIVALSLDITTFERKHVLFSRYSYAKPYKSLYICLWERLMQNFNCIIVMFYSAFVKRKIIKREIFRYANIIPGHCAQAFYLFLIYLNINRNIYMFCNHSYHNWHAHVRKNVSDVCQRIEISCRGYIFRWKSPRKCPEDMTRNHLTSSCV